MKKRTVAALVVAIVFAAALPLMARDEFQQNARLGRGVNILGWDALWRDRARGQFKDVHFKLIREAGFNHVRINLHPLRDGQPDANGKLRNEFFQTLDWAVDQALANGLLVILDYHDDLAISPDPEGKKKEFLDSWTAIADHCKNRPDNVFFEILNEPASKFTQSSWNEYWRAALAIIRQSNPNRTVIIGPEPWNNIGALDSLKLPADDRNIIATVHYYNPFSFTHQGTPWTGEKDKSGVKWTGTDSELKAMEQDFSKVAAWANQNHRPVYIGEFGTYERGEMPSRVRWTAYVARQFEKQGWSWGCWQFTSDFALFEMKTQQWVEPLRDALIPKQSESGSAIAPNPVVTPLPLREAVTTRLEIPAAPPAGLTLYLAPRGDDQSAGTADRPFATLERARDELRAIRQRGTLPSGGVTVLVHGGEYLVSHTFNLTSEDSGNEAAPVRYCAAPGENVVFRGGVRLSNWKLLTDPNLYPLLPPESLGKVWYTDLKSVGLTNPMPLKLGGFSSGNGFTTHPAHELFFNGQALQLARGPNEGFLHIADVVVKDGTKGYDRAGSKTGIFTYQGDLPRKWVAEPDLLLYGYWFWDWADSYERVASIDPEKRVITLAKPWHTYGFRIGAPFYAYNALSELDLPGEWYLDRVNSRLLLYPPSDLKSATVEMSTFPAVMLEMKNVSHVCFEGLTWELGSADAIHLQGGSNCLFAGCTVRHFAGNAIDVRGGSHHGLLSCDIYSLGRGGVALAAGNRKTLSPGGSFIENCDIHDLSRIDHTYTPAIILDGVGNRVRHNRLHDIRSSAIRLEGNDHTVEYNEVYNVVTESDDQGGIDMFGNPTYRGNVFRYNYWHHIGSWRTTDASPACGQCAIRLDDAICGTWIHGNIFERCSAGKLGFGGVQIHGGKDNLVENNLFADCSAMVSCSPWDEQRWQQFVKSALDNGAIDRELYLQKYPALAELTANINLNHVRNNRALRCGELLRRAPKNLDATNNIKLPEGELTLRPDNPLLTQPGFERIPVEEMGIYTDTWRKLK